MSVRTPSLTGASCATADVPSSADATIATTILRLTPDITLDLIATLLQTGDENNDGIGQRRK